MLLTVVSTGRVLELFSIECPEWGPTEMAVELGMSKSKAHSLLTSMADVGLLRRTSRGRYRLGWRLLGLNRVLADTTDFRCTARPVMGVLTAHFGETVHLGTLDGGEVVYVDRSQGNQATRIAVSAIGARMPAHCTGVGKVMLSQLDAPALDQVLSRHELEPRTPYSVTDVSVLKAELARIREREIAFDCQEAVRGISCVAAPIWGADGDVVAAISLTAPTSRFDAQAAAFETAIRRAARHVSRHLRRQLCRSQLALVSSAPASS